MVQGEAALPQGTWREQGLFFREGTSCGVTGRCLDLLGKNREPPGSVGSKSRTVTMAIEISATWGGTL